MAPTKNKIIETKQNSWQKRLAKNSVIALKEITKLTPERFEELCNARKKLIDELDSLQKSFEFFTSKYQENDAKVYIQQITQQMNIVNNKLMLISEHKTLGQLERINAADLEDSLVLIFNDLRLFFQVDNIISTDGLYTLTHMVVAEYRNLTLEEVAMCMAKAKKGHYGQLYNRLDGAIIMGWLKKHNEERLQRLQDRNYTIYAHSKIGTNEIRETKADPSEMLRKSHAAVAIEQALQRINKTNIFD